MSRPTTRTPPATLGAWTDLHRAHGRQHLDVKIGVYYVHRCSCGERAVVEETQHSRGEAAAITIRGG